MFNSDDAECICCANLPIAFCIIKINAIITIARITNPAN
jgi:hypothetical protein